MIDIPKKYINPYPPDENLPDWTITIKCDYDLFTGKITEHKGNNNEKNRSNKAKIF